MISVYFVNCDDIQNLSSSDIFIPGDFVEEFVFETEGEVKAFLKGLEKINDQGWSLVRDKAEAEQIAREYFYEYMSE